MTLAEFCALGRFEHFDCGPGWDGRIGYRVSGSNFAVCGFRSVDAARRAFVKEECGALAPAVLKLLKESQK